MQIEIMKLADLKPADYNPRIELTPGMDEYEKLKQSITEFGFIDPPIFNKRTGNLVGGHQRVAVAKDLGLCEEIEVSVVDLPLDKEKALNVALNKISGMWDDDKLAELLTGLDTLSLELTGFDENEIQEIINHYDMQLNLETEVLEDEYEVILPDEPKSKVGDIYQLGNHRLMCGDSTNEADVNKLLDGEVVDLLFTDPPYNIDYQGISDKRKIKNDSMDDLDFISFLEKSLLVCKAMYVCCSWQYCHLFKKAMENIGVSPKALIVWDKVNPAQHLDKYFKQHELIWYFGDFGGEKTIRGDIWEVPREKNTFHPTMKPIKLISIALKDNLWAKTVYDGFGGSGSTLITCEQLSKKAFLMELDPRYVDVIIDRWEEFTGKKAVKLN
ncbi:TPA: DNA modification methylase [Enterococcus faecium]|uniref:site-specific DNA-methyltransferase n=1 Tax=Enterococcus faecium TaxID=1352 RepID=UPI000BBC1CF4|nr:DNA methyltransferase [Enterococcus faecium]EGP0010242.1 DNA modification methylase [Enterococcus faecium]EGP5220665.1 DNA modification methylase [Enterococcus faecium]EGP5273307.1 DNA modification methylase [Enterococcus faecium]EIZ8426155.1 DNA modification methylase [Enterococcus faecium]EKG9126508.1 DNA modification methylase [Enterococcus faecium]